MSELTSTGRGGAGNIGHDAKVYAAGDITREGIEGVSADGEYSTGRGGAGNIGLGDGISPTGSGMNTPTHEPRRFSLLPSSRNGSRARGAEDGGERSRSRSRAGLKRMDEIVVPETATRSDDYKDFHTGRGGQGNIHKDKYAEHSTLAEERRASGAGVGGVGEKIKHLFGAGKE